MNAAIKLCLLATLLAFAQSRIGPRWTYDKNFEKPKGVKDLGGWTESYYTQEQQERLGVDMFGNKAGTVKKLLEKLRKEIKEIEEPMTGGSMSGSVGPSWTYDKNMEKPMGEKNMGTYTESVYTAEQQKRLGVDAEGKKVKFPMSGTMGPRWTWDPKMEKPTGEKNMGTYTESVYTAE